MIRFDYRIKSGADMPIMEPESAVFLTDEEMEPLVQEEINRKVRDSIPSEEIECYDDSYVENSDEESSNEDVFPAPRFVLYFPSLIYETAKSFREKQRCCDHVAAVSLELAPLCLDIEKQTRNIPQIIITVLDFFGNREEIREKLNEFFPQVKDLAYELFIWTTKMYSAVKHMHPSFHQMERLIQVTMNFSNDLLTHLGDLERIFAKINRRFKIDRDLIVPKHTLTSNDSQQLESDCAKTVKTFLQFRQLLIVIVVELEEALEVAKILVTQYSDAEMCEFEAMETDDDATEIGDFALRVLQKYSVSETYPGLSKKSCYSSLGQYFPISDSAPYTFAEVNSTPTQAKSMSSIIKSVSNLIKQQLSARRR